MSKKIVVVQRRMTHYRVAFFERLRRQLASRGLDLLLAYGDGNEEEQRKNDGADIAWAKRLPPRYFYGGRVCYQSITKLGSSVAMFVLTTEQKLIYSLWHQQLRRNALVCVNDMTGVEQVQRVDALEAVAKC